MSNAVRVLDRHVSRPKLQRSTIPRKESKLVAFCWLRGMSTVPLALILWSLLFGLTYVPSFDGHSTDYRRLLLIGCVTLLGAYAAAWIGIAHVERFLSAKREAFAAMFGIAPPRLPRRNTGGAGIADSVVEQVLMLLTLRLQGACVRRAALQGVWLKHILSWTGHRSDCSEGNSLIQLKRDLENAVAELQEAELALSEARSLALLFGIVSASESSRNSLVSETSTHPTT